jgi:hypothetical protein
MRLTVKLDMDNAAFDSDMCEAGRILRDLAFQLEASDLADPYDLNVKLRDFNGNAVGTARIT